MCTSSVTYEGLSFRTEPAPRPTPLTAHRAQCVLLKSGLHNKFKASLVLAAA